MKKTLSAFIFLVLICTIVLISCGTAHTHNFGEWTVVKQPTCTEDGMQEGTCSCGEKQTKSIPATGHSFDDWLILRQPTCTEDGIQERTCSCGEKQTKSIPTTGHNYNNLVCTVCGKYSITINETGESYTDKNGLTVTLEKYTTHEYEGYIEYSISYTIVNNVPDSKLMPGSFKLFFDDNTGENQYGGFNYLFYGDKSTRSYSWKVLKSQTVLVLEYNADDSGSGLDGAFFRKTPAEDSMHWIAPIDE